MYSLPVRIAAAVGALALGAASLLTGSGAGWVLLVAAALLVAGHFRNGSIWLASRALRRGDLERMETLLGRTPDTRWMSRHQRPYYELMMGIVRSRQGDLARAREHFRAALQGRLRTPKDRSFVHLQLAEVERAAGRVARARAHLAAAREGSADAELEPLIESVERRLREEDG